VLLLPGIAALVAAQWWQSLALLLAATAVGGVATGLGYRCGLEVVNEIAQRDERSRLVSTYLLVCYVAISLPVIGVAFLSKALSPMGAVAIFGAVNVVLACFALVYEIRVRRPS
jgi:MFS family permease